MTLRQQRLALITARLGGRVMVRRFSRARSLRWAVRVHLVTLVVAALAGFVAAAVLAEPARSPRRGRTDADTPGRPAPRALTPENHLHQ